MQMDHYLMSSSSGYNQVTLSPAASGSPAVVTQSHQLGNRVQTTNPATQKAPERLREMGNRNQTLTDVFSNQTAQVLKRKTIFIN